MAKTSGSTGRPGVFLADGKEWASIIASYSRAQEWAGIRASLTDRTRLAVVSSRVPWHQSALVGLSVDSPIVPVRRFDATSEMSDTISLSADPCACGRVFRVVGTVAGRSEDVLRLRRPDGSQVAIHPNVFHRALELAAIRAWQVVQEEASLVARVVAGPEAPNEAIVSSIRRELQSVGAAPPPIRVERVAAMGRTSIGKAPLIQAYRARTP